MLLDRMDFLSYNFSIMNKLKNKDQSKNTEPAEKTIAPIKNKEPAEKPQTSQEEIQTNSKKIAPCQQSEYTRIVSEEDTLIAEIQSKKESPAHLLLLNGPKNLIGHTWPLTKMVTSLGRSSRLNDITVDHNSLSKTHFQIINENDSFYIVDLKSTNKTYLNDDELDPYQKIPLENNSYIQASHLIFKFLDKGNIESHSSKQLLKKAQTDPLTLAGNRLLLKAKGPEYFFSNQNLSLITFDVDDFKQINDRLGHIAGDYALKELSKCVLEIVREKDLFIRYGGDEFVIFTANPLPIAQNIADRIKEKLKARQFECEGKKFSISISIGLAEKLPSDTKWENIYHRADQLSYQDKQKKKTNMK